jgi:hypothetical protein
VNGLPTIAALVAGLALVWALGGLALRLGGALAFWAGLAGLLAGDGAAAALVVLAGALAWLLGQCHRLLRHGEMRSPLARAILGTLSGLVSRGDRS